MVLNYIWVALFLISFIVALIKLIFLGDTEVFSTIINGTFDSSKDAFTFALGLTGALTLWLGLMKVGEKSGIVDVLAKVIGPFFRKIFPEIPNGHPVSGHILMNFSANMLGLDNAATPLGLKAMQGMQELNPEKEKASNAQIMFLTLNASGLTIVPISIMAARATAGAANPSDVFVPILIATFFSTLTGLITVCIFQKINLFNKVILLYLGAIGAFIGFVLWYFSTITQEQINSISSFSAAFILFSLIISFISFGVYKKINVYDTFIEGAKEGFESAIRIIPYVVAILVAVSMFRNCGAMNMLMNGLGSILIAIGVNPDFLPALPTALMKPLSGSGSRAMMIESINTFGVDSFVARLSSVFQGAADTTFYILTVYFGFVGVKNTRYALTCCLIADLAGVIAAILVSYMFFH